MATTGTINPYVQWRASLSRMSDWIAIGALAVVAVMIPVSMMVISWLIRPSVPEQGKRATYESGEVPTGSSHNIRFNIQYYMVALLFVIFDIETVLIFPWTVIYQDAVSQAGLTAALVPMLVFIGVLVVGLAWAWRNGAVKWVRSPRASEQRVDQQ
jgi:NADH-quinone oxidoreductase subunit A